jgi:hypothetical protein
MSLVSTVRFHRIIFMWLPQSEGTVFSPLPRVNLRSYSYFSEIAHV